VDASNLSLSREHAIRESLTGRHYRKIIEHASDANNAIKQWRLAGHNALNVASEELPSCRGTTIFSKQYKAQVKAFTEAFELTSKAVQFLRFLLLKLPEVRKAEEMQEGRGGALDVGQMLQQLTDVAKKVAAGDS